MPSDTDLLDALDAFVQKQYGDLTLEFKPTHLGGRYSWQVSMKAKHPNVFATGGGADIREAMSCAITNLVETRITGE